MGESGSEVRDRVMGQFGKNARKYVESETHSRGQDLDTMIEWISPERHWICLDIATGGGHAARKLSPRVEIVVAVDITEQMLKESRKSHEDSGIRNIVYVRGDAEDLPFIDASFDAVICRIAPHHFLNKEKFVSEVNRVLKAGGTFLLIDNVAPEDPKKDHFMNQFEWLRDRSHVRCLSEAKWKELILDSGMDVIKTGIRKKSFDFSKWVTRTAESDSQVSEVRNYLLSSTEELKDYFGIRVSGEDILSLQIDEAMILGKKQL